jgi:hypothetical protein
MTVTCIKCKKCGTYGRKDMKWETITPTTTAESQSLEEVLVCDCGGKEWLFVNKNGSKIGPEILVVNNSVTIQQDVEIKT